MMPLKPRMFLKKLSSVLSVKTDTMPLKPGPRHLKSKTLYIVRHGKALQDYWYIHDYDRPLIEKGIVNSVATAKQLFAKYPAPDLIISSHAARALHTAHIFAQVTGYPHDRVQVNERLYLDGERETPKILGCLTDEIESVMMVGHNPDVTYLANTYAKQSIDVIPTSGVVTIRFETNRWSEISKVNSDLLGILKPDKI